MDFRIVWTASARCTAPAGRDKTTGVRGCQCLLKPLEIAKSIGYRHFSRFFRNRSVHPMKLIDEIVANKAQLTAWRRDLHMHPETAFEEHRTADFVAKALRSEAHTSELQSLMRISYAVFCLKQKRIKPKQ